MAQSSKKTIYHEHSLTEVCSDKEFLCDGCMTLGNETRYRCRPCDFDLHKYCATCPVELSSFMHQHVLKLVARKPLEECTLTGPPRICDLCRDPVEGLFYQCKICDFDVHPICTQLPEFVRHVLHREHPLRLQPSVSGFCVFCKDVCNTWRYRCGICSFDLHLECVLKPCKEVMKMSMVTSSTTTSRSLGPQQQSSPPDLFNAYLAANIGNGAMIRPQPQPQQQQYFACNYGVPFGLPVALASYCHGHGYGHGHTLAMPSTCSYGNSVVNNTPQQSNSQVQQGGGSARKVRKEMYAIAGNLALGVLSNVPFGTIFT